MQIISESVSLEGSAKLGEKHTEMDSSEQLALWVLMNLLPESSQIVHLQQQSHGEHDFDVRDETGSRIAIVEVTAAIHEISKQSLIREQKHGAIRCGTLNHGWLLMAHNPDPRWVQNEGCEHLAVFEQHSLTEFEHDTRYHPNDEVAKAAKGLAEMGIESGGRCGAPGVISFLTSRGECSDDWTISSEHVIEVLIKALEQPDNLAKLSIERHGAGIDRYFFVVIDPITHPAASFSMTEVAPPTQPLELNGRATHVWVAMRNGDVIVVWRGDTRGWDSWELSIDASLCS